MYGWLRTKVLKEHGILNQRVISNTYEWVKNTSTITPLCMDTYIKEPDFFHNLYFHKDNPRQINWARVVRTFVESGGDINYFDQYRVEMILQFNNISDVLTPDVVREFITCGFSFEGKSRHHIGYYGYIGAYGVHHNYPLKIDAMEIICRRFDWIGNVEDQAIKRFVFGINGHSEDYSRCNLEFQMTKPLIEMHERNDHTNRMKQMWDSFPSHVQEKMTQDVQEFMNNL